MSTILLLMLTSLLGLFGTVGGTDVKNNLTQEECLSIERTVATRHSAKVVNAVENNPAYLHCAIGSPNADASSDFLVAWTRLRDDALLTAGGRAFTSDARFQISPKRQTRDWVLLIRHVQAADQGCYLCEINTEPLSTLIPVYLNVIPVQETPKRLFPDTTQKLNANLVAQMEGNSIILTCTVTSAGAPSAPTTVDLQQDQRSLANEVLWTKNGEPIDFSREMKYTSQRKTDRNNVFVHVIRIWDASSLTDDGLYACEGEHSTRATQMVHVNDAGTSTTFSSAIREIDALEKRLYIIIILMLLLLQ